MEPTDQRLIADTLDGHLEAYDKLMGRYQRWVYTLAWGYAKSHEGALDLTQTVFLKVYRKLSSFRGNSGFKTWLTRIAANEGVSWVRANRRHLDGREPFAELEEVRFSQPDQEAKLTRRQNREFLLTGLSRISARYRTALILRYFHELPVREVASVLGCSEGTAKNVLFRGMKRLREQLAGG